MDVLTHWFTGPLSTADRVWGALAPAIVVAAYFLVGLLVYAIRTAARGPYRDPDIERRGASPLVGMYLRQYFSWLMRPVWFLLRKSGLPATAVTTFSVLLALGAGVALAAGRFALGGWLYIFAGICDFLDGRLARATGRATPSGAALDSILDRYADAAVLCGLAWYYRSSWVLLACIAALVGSMLVSYVRARGEGLGIEIKTGLMQRPERIVYLGAATAMSPIVEASTHPANPHPLHWLAVAGILLLAVSTQVTAASRLVVLLRRLGGRAVPRWIASHRARLYPLLTSASLATAVDLLVMSTLVTRHLLRPGPATAAGCLVGALINFTVIHRLTRRAGLREVFHPGRYAFVSLTSALLNAGGVSLVLLLPRIELVAAWLLVRGAVFATWNFPLHKDYVFVEAESGAGRPDEPPVPG